MGGRGEVQLDLKELVQLEKIFLCSSRENAVS